MHAPAPFSLQTSVQASAGVIALCCRKVVKRAALGLLQAAGMQGASASARAHGALQDMLSRIEHHFKARPAPPHPRSRPRPAEASLRLLHPHKAFEQCAHIVSKSPI